MNLKVIFVVDKCFLNEIIYVVIFLYIEKIYRYICKLVVSMYDLNWELIKLFGMLLFV